MVFHGRVQNGQIVLDDHQATLPEGAAVRIDVMVDGEAGQAEDTRPPIWDKLLKLAGTAEGLPEDYSRNHDHYLYGAPKGHE